MLEAPLPDLDALLTMMGDVGRHLAEIQASEGTAGNMSVCMRWPVDVCTRFPVAGEIELPQPVPELEDATFLVTGSGRRLRDIKDDPAAHIACVVVNSGGRTARLHTSRHRRFERVTSEFNSHLAVHHDQMVATGANFHALIHAHPVNLTFLSHVPCYQDKAYLNAHLLRWQPEMIVNLPEGIGFIPFCVPSSPELMAASVASLRTHRVVVWAKHGVMARSDLSLKRAADWVEYAETAANYEYHNLMVGELGEGLSAEDIRGICRTFGVKQNIF